jgi:hypothetical protein
VVREVNVVLGTPGSPAYNEAKRIVGTTTAPEAGIMHVADAVTASPIYASVLASTAIPGAAAPATQVTEAKNVFHALPHHVDQVILAALRSGFEYNLPINVAWIELDAEPQALVHTGAGGKVMIHLACRPGNTFPAAP